MKRSFLTVSLLLFVLSTFSQVNLHQKKLALVVGVAKYVFATSLANPVNDAIDISGALTDLGFEVVILQDPTMKELNRGIAAFEKAMVGADVCLFFFSGHGCEYTGENYLFPRDAFPEVPDDLSYQTYPLSRLINKM